MLYHNPTSLEKYYQFIEKNKIKDWFYTEDQKKEIQSLLDLIEIMNMTDISEKDILNYYQPDVPAQIMEEYNKIIEICSLFSKNEKIKTLIEFVKDIKDEPEKLSFTYYIYTIIDDETKFNKFNKLKIYLLDKNINNLQYTALLYAIDEKELSEDDLEDLIPILFAKYENKYIFNGFQMKQIILGKVPYTEKETELTLKKLNNDEILIYANDKFSERKMLQLRLILQTDNKYLITNTDILDYSSMSMCEFLSLLEPKLFSKEINIPEEYYELINKIKQHIIKTKIEIGYPNHFLKELREIIRSEKIKKETKEIIIDKIIEILDNLKSINKINYILSLNSLNKIEKSDFFNPEDIHYIVEKLFKKQIIEKISIPIKEYIYNENPDMPETSDEKIYFNTKKLKEYVDFIEKNYDSLDNILAEEIVYLFIKFENIELLDLFIMKVKTLSQPIFGNLISKENVIAARKYLNEIN